MNAGIEKIKSALYTYKQQRDFAAERVKAIAADYGTEAGERERERQEKKLAAHRADAERVIYDECSYGIVSAEKWGKLDGSKLTDDAKLLEADLVDVESFEQLKAKYAGNATMLQALKKYGERKNEEDRQTRGEAARGLFLTEKYTIRDIPTVQDKVRNWDNVKKLAYSLLDVMDKAEQTTDWTVAFAAAALPKQLENFGDGFDCL